MSMLNRSEILIRKNTDDEIVWRELVEEDMYRLSRLQEFLPFYRGRYILDIGAHIGIFGRLSLENFTGKVVKCYEPEPENFECLTRNSISGMELYPLAVSATEQAVFLKKEKAEYTGRHQTQTRMDAGCIPLKQIDLKSIFQDTEQIFLLKIDIEGYEYALFERFEDAYWQNIEMLIIEWHSEPLPDAFFERNGMVKLFNPGGTKRHAVWLKEIPESTWWKRFAMLQKELLEENFQKEKEKLRAELKWDYRRVKTGIKRRWNQWFG